MKLVMFGAGNHLRHEMDNDVILSEVTYFVDDSPHLIGTSYLGKPICSPELLLSENKGDFLIVIASLLHKSEISIRLNRMGFEEHLDYEWAPNLRNNPKYSGRGFYITFEWKSKQNEASVYDVAKGERFRCRLSILASLADFTEFDAVIDLGAGSELLSEFLPDGPKYYPVDYIRSTERTIVCDLNKHFPDSHMLGGGGGG